MPITFIDKDGTEVAIGDTVYVKVGELCFTGTVISMSVYETGNIQQFHIAAAPITQIVSRTVGSSNITKTP